MVNGIKADAEGQDDNDAQKRLLAAAKVLADATAKLVEAAKVFNYLIKHWNSSKPIEKHYLVLRNIFSNHEIIRICFS